MGSADRQRLYCPQCQSMLVDILKNLSGISESERITRIRKDVLNLSQVELERITGYAIKTISGWENGNAPHTAYVNLLSCLVYFKLNGLTFQDVQAQVQSKLHYPH